MSDSYSDLSLDGGSIHEAIVDSMDDAAIVVNDDRRLVYANGAALSFGEAGLDDLRGHDAVVLADRVVTDEQDVQSYASALDSILDGSADRARAEMPVEYPSTSLCVEFRMQPICVGDEVRGAVVIGRDISERKDRERASERASEFMHQTELLADTGGWEVDAETLAVEWTDGTREIHGVSADFDPTLEQAKGFFHPDDRSRLETVFERCLNDGGSYDEELRIVTADDEARWVETTGEAVIEDGEIVRIRGAIQDITEYKHREQELTEHRRKLQQISENIDEVVWMNTPTQDNLEFVSDAFEDIWGYEPATLYENPMLFVEGIHPEDRERVIEALEAQKAAPDEYAETYRVVKPDGEVRWVHDTSAGVYENGDLQRIIGIARDVTERKQRERDLEQFAYAASHDLREPLRVISNYLQLLERRHGETLDADAQEYVDFAVDAAARMEGLIDGLLAYSRVDRSAETQAKFDLNDAFEDARANLRIAIEQSDATITCGSLPTVTGNREQLTTVFQNLLDNALTYAGDDPPSIEITTMKRDNIWHVTVADDGIGMDPAQSDRAFELFERLDVESDGTGLGLALCKKIVERHDGQIWLDTGPGEGTAVTFTLPKATGDT